MEYLGAWGTMIHKKIWSRKSRVRLPLKGQCHEIFCLWFFSWISFPQAPEYTIRAVSNFLRKFAEIFAAQGWPPVSTTPVANLPLVSTTPVAKLPPVSPTPVANLPPVSMTPTAKFATSFTSVVDTGGKFAAGVNDTGGKLPPVPTQRHRRQIGLISSCRYLKVNMKAKMYICVNSTIQRCPNKIIKIFWLKIFLICHRDTGGQPWAANKSANFPKIS